MSKFNHTLLLILEKTFDIQEDVDFIWDKGFKKLVNLYKKSPEKYITLMRKYEGYVWKQIDSGKLESENARKAHKQNPIKININLSGSNNYDFERREINLSINHQAVEALGGRGFDNSEMVEEYPFILNEFSPEAIKSVISHEIAHWLDETLHDEAASKMASKYFYGRKNSKDSPTIPKDTIAFYHTGQHELVANVETIKTIKNITDEGKWESMNFEDILDLKPNLKLHIRTARQLGPEGFREYLRRLYTRLNREGILGKNMHKFFKNSDFADFV